MTVHCKLFQADRFSDSAPLFRTAESATAAAVQDLLDEHYRGQTGRVFEVSQFGGAEVNSKNFKIRAKRGLFLLKKTVSADGAIDVGGNLDQQLELLAWLAQHGHPVPLPVMTDDGAFHIDSDETVWHLLSFVEGNYFSGAPGMIAPTGAAIGRLLRDLSKVPSRLIPNRQLPDTRAMDNDVIALIADAAPTWPALFGDADAALIRASWPLIIATNEALTEQWDGLQQPPNQLTHIDLHPHNIIMRGNDVAGFLDFESCMMAPAARVVGFAAYKLMRQACVIEKGITANDPAAATRKFLAALTGAFAMSDRQRQLLPLQAKAEVMRRLALILRLNLETRDFSWNWVLPMHLSGLREVERLFATNK